MLEETTPRTSAKWVPHSTYAAEMGMTDKKLAEAEHVESGVLVKGSDEEV